MCGIVGFTGKRSAVEVILAGLSQLEYRGYDSAGMSVALDSGVKTLKSAGRIASLIELTKACPQIEDATCGIGHTRWATHGAANDRNAHPHATDKLTLVHNGIVENYRELRGELEGKGYTFESETDTEVAAKLIDSLYSGDPTAALAKAAKLLEGSYALCVLFAGHASTLYGIRKSSPLIVGVGEGENYIASDISALLEYTRNYIALEEGEIAKITPALAEVVDFTGRAIPKTVESATWNIQQARKGGYPNFMIKEIHEQPEALGATLRPRISGGLPAFDVDGLAASDFNYSRIHIVGCGTASHSGLIGKDLIERLAAIPVEVSLGSEFRYRQPILPKGTLVMAISQSGETADTLAAIRLAKERGLPTLAIVNVPGSTLSREADVVLYTHAGPEISVASTKAFIVQIGLLYLIAIKAGLCSGNLAEADARGLVSGLLEAVDSIPAVLEKTGECKQAAESLSKAGNIYFIGRGLDWLVGMEGSLKLKELSYIHSEAYAAGELKHGAISLIVPDMPVIALATQEKLIPKTLSNVQEAAARGASILLLHKDGADVYAQNYAGAISLPALDDLFMPIPVSVALQLIAYHTAMCLGCDVDKPRNLAKSVTVE